ncbi:hypothetical protein PR048_001264 [Dryococelus australis]|uniref:Uncharacterized protein n=1 Tax=Dryococelus australis TaxID=614101 RepID=A0ABQ9IGV6_9NEOP|nr:hypothetical protein PR048_001264 [Dryococelus australis]
MCHPRVVTRVPTGAQVHDLKVLHNNTHLQTSSWSDAPMTKDTAHWPEEVIFAVASRHVFRQAPLYCVQCTSIIIYVTNGSHDQRGPPHSGKSVFSHGSIENIPSVTSRDMVVTMLQDSYCQSTFPDAQVSGKHVRSSDVVASNTNPYVEREPFLMTLHYCGVRICVIKCMSVAAAYTVLAEVSLVGQALQKPLWQFGSVRKNVQNFSVGGSSAYLRNTSSSKFGVYVDGGECGRVKTLFFRQSSALVVVRWNDFLHCADGSLFDPYMIRRTDITLYVAKMASHLGYGGSRYAPDVVLSRRAGGWRRKTRRRDPGGPNILGGITGDRRKPLDTLTSSRDRMCCLPRARKSPSNENTVTIYICDLSPKKLAGTEVRETHCVPDAVNILDYVLVSSCGAEQYMETLIKFRSIRTYDNIRNQFTGAMTQTELIRAAVVKVFGLLASHKGEQGSIPGMFAPGFPHVGIVAGRCRWLAVFLGDLLFPPSLNSGAAPYLVSPSSALKNSLLRAAQISPLLTQITPDNVDAVCMGRQ